MKRFRQWLADWLEEIACRISPSYAPLSPEHMRDLQRRYNRSLRQLADWSDQYFRSCEERAAERKELT